MNKPIPQGYIDSPLGIIPKEWEVKRLGEVCDYVDYRGKSPNKSSNGIFLVTAKNIRNGFIDYETSKEYIPSDEYEETMRRGKVQVGDVLITTEAPLGHVAQIDNPNIALAQRVIKYRGKKEILNTFLKYYLMSEQFQTILIANATGSTALGIKGSRLHQLPIIIPALKEQEQICIILQLWDTAIEKQSELIEKLTLRKRALMQQLLTGKKRLTGFSREWKRIKLDNIAERVTRKNEEENKNVVTISAQRGFVVQTDFFNKSVASETLDNYFLVYKDEFCYNKSSSNGYPMGAIKRLKTFDEAVVTTLYICFRLKDKASANIDFFEQYCESGIFNKELVKVANEGGRAHGLLNVTPSDFFNMHMSIPNIDEQNAIASVLVNADKEIELANEKLANLQSQKRGLMQQLLTGKKRILKIKEGQICQKRNQQ